MAIDGRIQPLDINIDKNIRLRKPNKDEWHYALDWYHNDLVMYYSEGITDRYYVMSDIIRMYSYLSKVGELYFIEVFEEEWKPIGDVTLSQTNLPIVIGDESYWGKGIGKKVLLKLLERCYFIGIEKIINLKIYHYNKRSQRLFQSVGFQKVEDLERAGLYELTL